MFLSFPLALTNDVKTLSYTQLRSRSQGRATSLCSFYYYFHYWNPFNRRPGATLTCCTLATTKTTTTTSVLQPRQRAPCPTAPKTASAFAPRTLRSKAESIYKPQPTPTPTTTLRTLAPKSKYTYEGDETGVKRDNGIHCNLTLLFGDHRSCSPRGTQEILDPFPRNSMLLPPKNPFRRSPRLTMSPSSAGHCCKTRAQRPFHYHPSILTQQPKSPFPLLL
ncbi:hypothetical protein K435DRAFT_853451 [Dendrothele bispora CBS 962.96]|uniref:Uncharacterized protein n=1 Tax=Dendrothele bispora (strain CBS 962.96) TaxID=1314807 RepID=A0A4S8MGF6_DENBC|nr:hypothetical protein K435DRAFT_853451 [Dendrothele bispora CBS 962.96]